MKKVISFLLCLMIIFTALPLAMGEDPSSSVQTVSTITFTLTLPKPGTKADGHPVATVPAGAPYHVDINQSAWVTKENGSFYIMPSDTVFEPGKSYYAGIWILPDNCEFADNAKIVCTNAKVVDPWVQYSYAGPVLLFTFSNEMESLSKLKSVKLKAVSAKKIEVTWKKLSKKEQGKIQKIQIQYSTDKTFKTGVKTKYAKKTKNSYTIKGLKKNKKYYIRIRAYKKVGNVIYVSKWVTKNKKTKK